jgi:hypothetical protein
MAGERCAGWHAAVETMNPEMTPLTNTGFIPDEEEQ